MFGDGDIYFGIKEQSPGYRFTTEHYDISQIILVTHGELRFFGTESARLLPGDFCLLVPGSAFRLRCETAGYRGIACEFWQTRRPDLPLDSSVHTADSAMRLLGKWVEDEYLSEENLDRKVIENLCRTIFSMGMRLRLRLPVVSVRRSEEYHAERAMELIQAHAMTGRPLHEVLKPLPVSYRHLSRYFRLLTGMSPKQYYDKYRMKLAARYLELTDMDITSIALELGFSSSQHFSQTFRRISGRTPTDFRKKAPRPEQESV
ncbi:AraC family transcriptional regulator [Marispirochaeta aestuarii]|uniref:helix-turn-helix transcriptional regulator n=1 Tax=Marispirochaeta aestuarii TaxID=1963862 RepID=UPI0029C611F8|nr:AraC family transcriptional regulator [Marispirochaeta aestuarii]